MAKGKGTQVGVQLNDHEKELLEKLAHELGKPLATVVREAALEGVDTLLEKLERRKKFINGDSPKV